MLIPFVRRRSLQSAEDIFRNFFERSGSALSGFAGFNSDFKLDVSESQESYTVTAELPGISKEDIQLELADNGYLTIFTNQEECAENENSVYVHRERRASSAQRTIHLSGASSEGVQATLENGILTININKSDKKKTSIEID